MKVLLGCEYSGVVRDAFIKKGHSAISCDLLPTDNPGNHYQGDIRDLLYKGWDLMVCHPPCTYLASSGMHRTVNGYRDPQLTEDALEFVQLLLNAPIDKIALENPVGCISTRIRKPDQYIQPYQFGHDASKKTGLWLKNLPLLNPTEFIEGRMVCCGVTLDESVGKYGCPNCCGDNAHKIKYRWANQTDSGQNRLPPTKDRWKKRSTTYAGIAKAMAEQWG